MTTARWFGRLGAALAMAAPLAIAGAPAGAGDDEPATLSPPPTALKADAGDDQLAVVGRQVTLNGIRSTPRGKVGFRWIQVGGPKVVLKIEDRYIYTFVPHVAGNYRFVLVVAEGGAISEPATVGVTAVATPPAAANPASASAETEAEAEPLDRWMSRALGAIDGGPAAGGRLAEAFDEIAGRVGLYRSYADAFSEMSRRLDAIVPDDPDRRGPWLERLFVPLSGRLVAAMLERGLDLRKPEGQAAPWTADQRDRLAELLRAMAAGCRAAAPKL
ncbi:MAG TPA: hypothetical protein VG406_04235 [Isosphaeraceae bacterium]|jgi:hypothetical protein|nr:hypothetical protein [Isosphaeraceae bacterium]